MTYVVIRSARCGRHMREPKLSRLEFRAMEVLWERGPCAIRDILAAFPANKKPAYTTIQTVVYRMEAKNIVRRVKKVGNFRHCRKRSMRRQSSIESFLAARTVRLECRIRRHSARQPELSPGPGGPYARRFYRCGTTRPRNSYVRDRPAVYCPHLSRSI
jgi:predicted transcriptional regulator